MKHKEPSIVEITRSLALKHYPDVTGILLTGSQTEPDKVTPQSDIDIIVFSDYFSGVSTQILRDGVHKLDFTKISITDVGSVLTDYMYDHRGVILHMIMTGIIVKDDYGELEMIQDKAKELYSSGNAAIESELKVMRNNLAKVKKNILKGLDYRYNFFLVMEYVHLASSFHVLTNEGWFPSSSYRRAKHLLIKGKNSQFIDGLMGLVHDSFDPQEGDQEKFINLIDRYLNHPYTDKTYKSFHHRFVVSLKYKRQSVIHYLDKVLASIRSNNYLAPLFLYTQVHRYMFVLKGPFVLVFDNEAPEFNDNRVLKELYLIFHELNRPIQKVHIASCEYLIRRFLNIKLYDSLETFLSYISIGVHNTVRNDGEYFESKFMLIGQVILIQLAKSLGIERDLLSRISRYLSYKFRRGDGSNSNDGYRQIMYLNDKIQRKVELYYVSNVDLLREIHETSWIGIESIDMACWDMNTVQHFCEELSDVVYKEDFDIDKYEISILKRYVGDNIPLKASYAFMILYEFILNSLFLNKNSHTTVAYTLASSFSMQQNDRSYQSSDAC